MLASKITRPCKIHLTTTGTERDGMGDPIATTDPSGKPTVCELQQNMAQELRAGKLLEVTQHTLFLLPGEAINGWSEITVAPPGVTAATWDGVTGERYTLEGEPDPIRHPRTGVVHHIEATVRKVR